MPVLDDASVYLPIRETRGDTLRFTFDMEDGNGAPILLAGIGISTLITPAVGIPAPPQAFFTLEFDNERSWITCSISAANTAGMLGTYNYFIKLYSGALVTTILRGPLEILAA